MICSDIIDSDSYISDDTVLSDNYSVRSSNLHLDIDLCTITKLIKSGLKEEDAAFTEEYLYVDHEVPIQERNKIEVYQTLDITLLVFGQQKRPCRPIRKLRNVLSRPFAQ